MSSDILVKHKQLADELESAREALRNAEEAFLVNEAKLVKAIKENPLMRHMGLLGPESDLSDYIGSELTSERLQLRSDAPQEILPQKGRSLDPSLCKVIEEDPTEQIFIISPYLKLSGGLEEFVQSSIYDVTKGLHQPLKCGCLASLTDSQELASIVPEDAMRATLALYAAGISIWDWNAVTGEVYTCSQWEKNIGKPQPASPIEMLSSGFDSVCEECILRVMLSLGEAESDSFCLCVRKKKEKSTYLQLRGVCVRGNENEMLRILVAATETPQGYCEGGK